MRGVRIPNVDRPDTLLGGLTARQLAILAAAALPVWLAWMGTGHVVPVPLFAAFATALAAGAITVAFGQRDGLSGDRFLGAALRFARAPRRQVVAPEGVPPLPSATRGGGRVPGRLAFPARHIDGTGVIDLGPEGTALVCAAGSLNFGLRTEAEQASLVAAFARWCNSLAGSIQVVMRAERADLSADVAALDDVAGGLPHPALEAAARAHARFLAEVSERTDVFCRTIHVVFFDPRSAEEAGPVLVRRVEEAASALSAAAITLTRLDGPRALAALAAAARPGAPLPAGVAAPDAVIVGAHG